MFDLMDHQREAVDLLENGRILYGGVGAGKSLTALAYYMENEMPKDIYVITTAKKRDSLEWEGEAAKFGIGTSLFGTIVGVIKVDSWNNIKNYLDMEDAFFIFDEQRVSGHGAWVKSFLKIVQRNHWILLTATPGDDWSDYAPVFIANGWYRNLTQFRNEHCVYRSFTKYPQIMKYVNIEKLERLRNEILVEMPYIKHTNRILNYLEAGYDIRLWNMAVVDRWHPYENRPIKDVSELFRVMRKISNSDPSRVEVIRMLLEAHPKMIIFYNFDYELEILRSLEDVATIAEWNGHRKQDVPDEPTWAYLVQYQSGAEGWNCTETDAMVLYSLTYSYKNFIQAQGRIDRIDSPFTNLYYYILISSAPIDKAVRKALNTKKSFNERDYMKNGLFSANNLGADDRSGGQLQLF